jgi:hypothetical protein
MIGTSQSQKTLVCTVLVRMVTTEHDHEVPSSFSRLNRAAFSKLHASWWSVNHFLLFNRLERGRPLLLKRLVEGGRVYVRGPPLTPTGEKHLIQWFRQVGSRGCCEDRSGSWAWKLVACSIDLLISYRVAGTWAWESDGYLLECSWHPS